MSETAKELRAQAACTLNATTALECRVRALELEVSALLAAPKAKAKKKASAKRKAK